MNVDILEVLPDHYSLVADNMRQADKDEIWALGRYQPKWALEMSVSSSVKSYTAFIDGSPVCMFGVGRPSLVSSDGAPWLLGTDVIDKHPVVFLRHCKEWLHELSLGFDRLYNYVDARNKKSILWLQYLGFEIQKEEPHGVLKMPFHRFYKEV